MISLKKNKILKETFQFFFLLSTLATNDVVPHSDSFGHFEKGWWWGGGRILYECCCQRENSFKKRILHFLKKGWCKHFNSFFLCLPSQPMMLYHIRIPSDISKHSCPLQDRCEIENTKIIAICCVQHTLILKRAYVLRNVRRNPKVVGHYWWQG